MSEMMQVRETFVPRPGHVFFQADYNQLELHTWAQWCINEFGFSDLGDALNTDLDPHTEMAGAILGITPEEARARRKDKADKLFDEARQIAKNTNFGLPGGLGIARFIDMVREASEGRIILDEKTAKKHKNTWRQKWREADLYLKLWSDRTARGQKYTIVDPFTGRVRGDVGYADGANDGFQALGAAVAKRALYLVQRACFAEKTSPMYGARPVNFVHDEIFGECSDNAKAHDVAKELERLMVAAADEFLPDVKCKAPPLLMRFWSKSAVAVTDENGRLVPWPAEKRAA